jgi:hypothetical protein
LSLAEKTGCAQAFQQALHRADRPGMVGPASTRVSVRPQNQETFMLGQMVAVSLAIALTTQTRRVIHVY